MSIKVEQIMCEDIVTAHWTEDLGSAYKKMSRLGIRHLPVVDDRGELVGIISDRDFQRAMRTDTSYDSNYVMRAEFEAEALVRDYMSQPVKSVDESTDVKTVAHMMIEQKISAVLVINDDYKMVGIVTHEDLLQVLVDILDDRVETTFDEVESLAYNSPIGAVATSLSQAGI